MNMTAIVTDQAARTVQLNVSFDPTLDGAAKPWRADWGDGTVTTYAAGTAQASRSYAADGTYVIEVQDMNGDTRTHQEVLVGTKPYPVWDPEKVQPTPAERQARQRRQIAAMGYAKRYIG
jgi:hypothetical protein